MLFTKLEFSCLTSLLVDYHLGLIQSDFNRVHEISSEKMRWKAGRKGGEQGRGAGRALKIVTKHIPLALCLAGLAM